MMLTVAKVLLADEAMPDADRQRIRRQASPRIAVGTATVGDTAARFKEMPDTSCGGSSRRR